MTETERQRYLAEILPRLAVLGKTGFIAKEEIADTPGLPGVAGMATDMAKKG